MQDRLEIMKDRIEELKDIAEKDLYLDESIITSSSFKNGVIICKWVSIYQRCAAEIQRSKAEKDKIELLLYLYFTGKANNEQIQALGKQKPFGLKIDTKSDIERFIKASEQYIEASIKLNELEQSLKFIDETVQALKTQNFRVTNIINYLKFKNGE